MKLRPRIIICLTLNLGLAFTSGTANMAASPPMINGVEQLVLISGRCEIKFC